jgi:pre-rRNA-processing protein TSR2
MLDDFNVEAEDGSPMQVAQSLVNIYNECFQGNYSTVQRMQAQAAAGASRSQRARVPGEQGDGEDSSSDEEDGEGEDEDEEMEDVQAAPPQPPQPIVDEDGFTLVQRSRGRGR